MKISKKLLSLLLALLLVTGLCAAAPVTAGAETPSRSLPVLVTLEPVDASVDPGTSAVFTLIIEGLGTDPANSRISSVNFSSSDTEVAGNIYLSAPSSYTPSGSSEPTGLQYEVVASAMATGISYITATVTDTDGNIYTGTGTVTVRGITLSPGDITLETEEACVLFAERYGFTSSQQTTNLTWSKSPADGWISMGAHGTGRQNEAYYIKGNSVGSGEVTVSLRNGNTVVYSDTINVTVVPKKSIMILKDEFEVTTPIYLSPGCTATLNASLTGFSGDALVTWESSRPDIVSVSQLPEDPSFCEISGEAFSDDIVAIKASATDGSVTRTKTVYAINTSSQALSIIGAGIKTDDAHPGLKTLTVSEGETVDLAAQCRGLDSTATIWAATTDGGRVPVKLRSTVGGSTSITGRLSSNSPVIITAKNGDCTDTVYVTVLPGREKSIKISGPELGADGVLVLQPGQTADLSAELIGFGAESNPVITWRASVGKDNENPNGAGECPVYLYNDIGEDAIVTANETASADFANVSVSVEDNGIKYTDEIYVKVTGSNIIAAANYLSIFRNDIVTLQTVDGSVADWQSTSYKVYFDDPVNINPTAVNQVTRFSGAAATLTAKQNQMTLNPVKITATQNGVTDSAYVMVKNGSLNFSTVSFDLNGGYGTTPDPVVFSQGDTCRSIILSKPDAAYPADEGEYEFCGWSRFTNAIDNTNQNASKPIYPAGQVYTMPSAETSVTLYAVWAKKAEDAMFLINISGSIPAEPSASDSANYSRSAIYIEDALNPPGFYYNTDGVDGHLAKTPSDEDISRALSLHGISYGPGDRVIWYVVKRVTDDSAGLPNWHVDGVLLKENRLSLTYDSNISVANIENMPNPPRMICDAGYADFSITDKIPACASSSFIGWNTEPDGSGQWYSCTGNLYNGFSPPSGESVRTSISLTEDTTLYAVWTGTNIRAVWPEDTDHPDEATVIFGGREYTLSENNGWRISVPSVTGSYDAPEESPAVGGFRLSVSNNTLYSDTGGLTSVNYTLIHERLYTVKFLDFDGSELQSGEYSYGETPVYTGETPSRPATELTAFSFEGWSPEIEPVTDDAIYTAVYDELTNPVHLHGYSLTLGGDIGVNFYVELGSFYENAYALFTVGGKTVTVPVDPDSCKTEGDNKYYRFTCNVAPSQIGERITAEIHAEPYFLTDDYSVYDYLTTLSDDPELMQSEDLEGLAKAIATYGYCSNELFGTEEALTRHALYDDSGFDGITAQSLSEYKQSVSGAQGEITCAGSSLVLRTKTAIRHYFDLPEGKQISDYTFILGEGEDAVYLTPGRNRGRYYVEIPDIPSALLGEEKNVTVLNSGGEEVCSVTCSALSYAYEALSRYEAGDETVSAKLADTVKALTIYYYAARDYFESHGDDGGSQSQGGLPGGLGGLIGGGGQIGHDSSAALQSVSMNDITIIEGDSRTLSEIYYVVSRKAYSLRHIYSNYLGNNPGLGGTVTVQLTIAPGGEVIQRSVVSSTTGLSSFDSRILNEIGKWTWSKVKSGNVTVSFPLTFYSA